MKQNDRYWRLDSTPTYDQNSVLVQQLPVRGTRATSLPQSGSLSVKLVLRAC